MHLERAIYSGVRRIKGKAMKVQGNIEFTIVEQGPEKVVSEMPVADGVKNPFGVAHAGAILWFADVTATMLALGKTQAKAGMTGFPLAISLNANLLSNQSDGIFKAVSTFVKKGKTVSVIRTRVTGDGDRLIADVTTSRVLSK